MPMFASPSFRIPAVLRQFLLAATALFLASCGGGGSSNDNNPTVEPSSSYVGNWYNAAGDYYLVISADNTLSYRVCSSTGYRELTEATLNGNAVMVGSETVVHLQRTGNSLTYVEIPAFLFVLHSTIPATCRGKLPRNRVGDPLVRHCANSNAIHGSLHLPVGHPGHCSHQARLQYQWASLVCV
jgi:hypothetical protein